MREKLIAYESAPGFRIIHKENGGLSSARNVGMRAAAGEIVAYIDDDAYPGPYWLFYIAHHMMTTGHAAAGGPNLPPWGDGMIGEVVAHSPGGPNHVLYSDTIAEHIPGCNMAFRRDALLAINGFDERFRIAGDDVDLCWRIQRNGGVIGFHAGATVFHHRRLQPDLRHGLHDADLPQAAARLPRGLGLGRVPKLATKISQLFPVDHADARVVPDHRAIAAGVPARHPLEAASVPGASARRGDRGADDPGGDDGLACGAA
jgi:GT2 family glycosyltransferase